MQRSSGKRRRRNPRDGGKGSKRSRPSAKEPTKTEATTPHLLHRVSLSPDSGMVAPSVPLSSQKKSQPIVPLPVTNDTQHQQQRKAPPTVLRELLLPSHRTNSATQGQPPMVFHPHLGPYAQRPRRQWHVPRLVGFFALVACTVIVWATAGTSSQPTTQHFSELTLRQVLSDHAIGFHIALAPAFFGFYAYFGALIAWEDETITAVMDNNNSTIFQSPRLRSVAGGSAGAMAAILLAAGISPRTAADFCTTLGVSQFADFPGVGAVFRGDAFEGLMDEFLRRQNAAHLQLQHSAVPVAVSAFDLQTMEGKILTAGSMARAARASATFPLLFQPVGWAEGEEDYVLIDGGITDTFGLQGLKPFLGGGEKRERVINLIGGGSFGFSPPGPSGLDSPKNTKVEVISVTLQNLPQCGPWVMKNGPKAVEGARRAMVDSIDIPLSLGSEAHHYELKIDTRPFW